MLFISIAPHRFVLIFSYLGILMVLDVNLQNPLISLLLLMRLSLIQLATASYSSYSLFQSICLTLTNLTSPSCHFSGSIEILDLALNISFVSFCIHHLSHYPILIRCPLCLSVFFSHICNGLNPFYPLHGKEARK